jgi:hypothetical protein
MLGILGTLPPVLISTALLFSSSSLQQGAGAGGLLGFWTDRIAKNERVVFFPTLAHEISIGSNADEAVPTTSAPTHWNVSIHGWVFEPEEESLKRALFIKLLRKVLDIPSDQKSAFFLQKRVRPFVVDNQSFKRVHVEIGGEVYRMPFSGKNGHFQTNLIIPQNQLLPWIKNGTYVVPYRAKTNRKNDDDRIFEGAIHLVPSRGVSIISDIDDTIKITEVFKSKQNLLTNTFLKKFQPVPGMADVYQEWWNADPTTTRFHLVSSSVFQLYEELEDFRRTAKFPPASFHLKTIRPKKIHHAIAQLTADPLATKRWHIERIMERFPWRTFVLVGDSGEKDPEVYADIAKGYPDQIKAIFIRNVNNDTDPARLQGLSNTIQWAYFDDPKELLQYKIV